MTFTGICNRFATSSGASGQETALYRGLLCAGIYLCEFDPPRSRKFYVKVIGTGAL
jgi:hypothetical protein